MNRLSAFSLAAALAFGLMLPTKAVGGIEETFAVAQSDRITIRILNGRDGQPLGHLHLILIGGYDRQDMRNQFYREEVLTDARGQVRLPRQLENLPWLQVWVDKKALCQRRPRSDSFSVDRIRNEGLSTPNWCGTATTEDSPGVFTVFVKGKREPRKTDARAETAVATSPPQTTLPSPAQKTNGAVPCNCAKAGKVSRGAAVCGRIGSILKGVAQTL